MDSNINMSFRPKNLPKKTLQEEEYHRKLVEENRKRYIQMLKDKQDVERRIKELEEKKRINLKKNLDIWENDIIPNWSIKKKNLQNLKKYFLEGLPTSLRGKIWLMCIGNNFSITRDYYEIEVKKAM